MRHVILILALLVCGCNTTRKNKDKLLEVKDSGVTLLFEKNAEKIKDETIYALRVAKKTTNNKFKGSSIRIRVTDTEKLLNSNVKILADQTFYGSSLVTVYAPDHKNLPAILAHELAHAILHSNGIYGHSSKYDNKGLYNWKLTREVQGM